MVQKVLINFPGYNFFPTHPLPVNLYLIHLWQFLSNIPNSWMSSPSHFKWLDNIVFLTAHTHWFVFNEGYKALMSIKLMNWFLLSVTFTFLLKFSNIEINSSVLLQVLLFSIVCLSSSSNPSKVSLRICERVTLVQNYHLQFVFSVSWFVIFVKPNQNRKFTLRCHMDISHCSVSFSRFYLYFSWCDRVRWIA